MIKVKVIPTVIGALGTVPKGLEKELEKFEIEERALTIQNTVLLRSARIPKRVREI